MDKLNQYLQPLNSPVTSPKPTVGMLFDIQNEIQGRLARLSNVNIKNFVQSSDTSTASGTFGNGQALYLTTSLTPNPPHQNDYNFAIPFITIYQGTSAIVNNQIYPILGTVTPGKYQISGDMDWQATYGTPDPTTLSTWSGVVYNASAGNQSILFVTRWRYIQYNSNLQS